MDRPNDKNKIDTAEIDIPSQIHSYRKYIELLLCKREIICQKLIFKHKESLILRLKLR